MPKLLYLFTVCIILTVTAVYADAPPPGALGHPVDGPNHRHNFSLSATHSFRADNTGEREATEICIFCHTPHGGSTADGSKLWNRGDPETTSFSLYATPTTAISYNATAQAAANYYNTAGLYPNGASRLCMSCHDGISAIGDVLNDTGGGAGIPMLGGNDTIVDVRGSGYNTIIDLSTSHPISFVYDDNTRAAINMFEAFNSTYFVQFVDSAMTPLDGKDRMQCTTCHDPHTDTRLADDTYLPMWRYNSGITGSYDPVCNNCHMDAADYASGAH